MVDQEPCSSAFLPLPIPHGDVLRVLGPRPADAATTVDPLSRLDEPVTVIGSCLAAVCDARGLPVQPLEVMLVLDPSTVVPNKQVSVPAVGGCFRELSKLLERMPNVPGYEVFHEALYSREIGGEERILGPLLFCRKRRCIFAACSPRTAAMLAPVMETDRGNPARNSSGPNADATSTDGSEAQASWDSDARFADAKGADGTALPALLMSWDQVGRGPDDPVDAEVNIYAGRGGSCSLGIIKSLDELILDQGRVVELAAEMQTSDPQAAANLALRHACVACPERERCYPKAGGYAYAADRLVPISAAAAPVILRPYGAWRFDEAARVLGGLSLRDSLAERQAEPTAFEAWRAEQAGEFDAAAPPRLLAGETDGRELIEIARLKLSLVADLLAQLDVVWRETKRPHLCWNADTARVAWRRPGAVPAMCWGFQPILRKIGLQPLADIETRDGRPLAYPPAFSESAYLPPLAAEAARYFDEPRFATLFIKRAQPDGDELIVNVLVEQMNVAWELFAAGDALHASGEDWRAVLSPAGQRDPDDGEGLPFSGRMRGKVEHLRKGDQIERVECRWYPRFGQATDLHAVGILLFETLLAHDERTIHSFREHLAAEIAELTTVCLANPPEHRENQARAWLTERCEIDAPAAIWTRRNLLFRRGDRNRTRLDALPPVLWLEIMTTGLRMTTSIPGFSYCPDRACDAPRVGDGLLLPLLELRGLIALLDDQIAGRTAPATAIRTKISKI